MKTGSASLQRGFIRPYPLSRETVVGISGYAGFFTCFLAGAIWLTFLYNGSGGSVLMLIVWHIVWNAVNVAGAAVSNDVVAVTNVLLIPLSLVALVAGGPRKLSWSEKQVIEPT